jgi:Skp family chaperone for outer membrane proteins
MTMALVLSALFGASVAAQTPAPAAPAAPAPAQSAPAAPPPPFPADAKIGYVDPQVVLDNSTSGKAGLAQVEQLVQKKQTELAAKSKELQTLQQEIQANQSVWNSTVNSQKQAELSKLQNEMQYMQTQAQTETEALQRQMLEEFQDKVLPIIEALRAEKGLWMILTNTSGTIVALNPALDLSLEVVARLDAAK